MLRFYVITEACCHTVDVLREREGGWGAATIFAEWRAAHGCFYCGVTRNNGPSPTLHLKHTRRRMICLMAASRVQRSVESRQWRARIPLTFSVSLGWKPLSACDSTGRNIPDKVPATWGRHKRVQRSGGRTGRNILLLLSGLRSPDSKNLSCGVPPYIALDIGW